MVGVPIPNPLLSLLEFLIPKSVISLLQSYLWTELILTFAVWSSFASEIALSNSGLASSWWFWRQRFTLYLDIGMYSVKYAAISRKQHIRTTCYRFWIVEVDIFSKKGEYLVKNNPQCTSGSRSSILFEKRAMSECCWRFVCMNYLTLLAEAS